MDHSEGKVPVSLLSNRELPPGMHPSATFSPHSPEERKTDIWLRLVNDDHSVGRVPDRRLEYKTLIKNKEVVFVRSGSLSPKEAASLHHQQVW